MLSLKSIVLASSMLTSAWIYAPSAHALNLVQNGSFEFPSINATLTDGLNPAPYRYERVGSIDGWTINGSNLPILDTVPGYHESADGDQYVILESNAALSISQIIPTILGERYKLSFFYAPNTSIPDSPDDSLEILWEGNTLAVVDATTPAVGARANYWQQYSFFVTATSSLSSLEFRDGFAGGWYVGPLLDNVSLTRESVATAVPTPALLPGLIGLGVAALCKRKAEKVEA